MGSSGQPSQEVRGAWTRCPNRTIAALIGEGTTWRAELKLSPIREMRALNGHLSPTSARFPESGPLLELSTPASTHGDAQWYASTNLGRAHFGRRARPTGSQCLRLVRRAHRFEYGMNEGLRVPVPFGILPLSGVKPTAFPANVRPR
jgi:hypothetical protein